MDFHGDHTSTCTVHSGATKTHDWMVSVLGQLFRTVGHTVRTQHGETASAGQRRSDVEIRNYLQSQAGSRSLIFDLIITHDRFGSSSHVQQNGCLSHPQDLDAQLRIAAQRKIAAYQQQYPDNQNISFLPMIVSTSTRMHGQFLRLLFLQTHRETESHFTAAGMSSQTNNSEALRFKSAAFYNGLKRKSQTGTCQGSSFAGKPQCPRMCHRSSPNARSISHSPSAPPPSFTQSPYPPRSLVRDDQTHPHRPRLVVSHSTCPPLSSSPHANSFVIGPTVIKHTHTQKQNTFVSKNLSDETNGVAFMKKRSAHTTGSTVEAVVCERAVVGGRGQVIRAAGGHVGVRVWQPWLLA
jgi:hypothetical protein